MGGRASRFGGEGERKFRPQRSRDIGYAGKRYDPDRGVLRKCWVFVMTLAFSRHMYADLVFDQKVGTWLDLHVAAFECFQGVPRGHCP